MLVFCCICQEARWVHLFGPQPYVGWFPLTTNRFATFHDLQLQPTRVERSSMQNLGVSQAHVQREMETQRCGAPPQFPSERTNLDHVQSSGNKRVPSLLRTGTVPQNVHCYIPRLSVPACLACWKRLVQPMRCTAKVYLLGSPVQAPLHVVGTVHLLWVGYVNVMTKPT